jgi:hypothetical protein
MEQIAVGSYPLRFSLGLDWDGATLAFRYGPTHSEFIQQLRYTERQTGGGIVCRDHEVTLHPVVNGNARTTSVDRRRFNLSKLVRVPGGAKRTESVKVP